VPTYEPPTNNEEALALALTLGIPVRDHGLLLGTL